MKTKTFLIRFIPAALLSASLATFALTGCNKRDRAEAKANVKEAYQDTKDAMADGWDNVKSFSFDKRDDFSANAKALQARMDAELSTLRADYSEAKASASRKAAMDELKDSEANYKEKVAALGQATADTWDAAKQNVISAWDHLEASYRKARAD